MNISTEALIDILANLTPTTGKHFFEDYKERLKKETGVYSCVCDRISNKKNITYLLEYLKNKSFMDKHKNLFKEIDRGCKSTSKQELKNNLYEFFKCFYEYYSLDYGHHMTQTFKMEQMGIARIQIDSFLKDHDAITLKKHKNNRTIERIKIFSDAPIKSIIPYQINKDGINETGCTIKLENPTFVIYSSPEMRKKSNILIAETPDFDFNKLPTQKELENGIFEFSDLITNAINEGKTEIPELQGKSVKQLYKGAK